MDYMNLTPAQELSMSCMGGLPDHSQHYFFQQPDTKEYLAKAALSPNCQDQLSVNEKVNEQTDTEVSPPVSPQKKFCRCLTFTCMIHAVRKVLTDPNTVNDWPTRKEKIFHILENTYLNEKEIQKYVFVDLELPYTRNVVYSDNENFTLILMCWNPNMESKVHDHPCDGCFVKTLKGGVKESRYQLVTQKVEHPTSDESDEEQLMKSLVFESEYVSSENEVSYIDNFMGYHKIGCASQTELAITLHLYTPPFKTCKVTTLHLT
jgi:cysteine dioxygenase